MQAVRDKERRERERQLQRKPDEERGLGPQVMRDSAGRDEPLQVLLNSEADRWKESEEPERRARRPTAAQPLADAEHQSGQGEGEPPDEDRRRVSEVRVAAFGVKPHVLLRAGRDEPVRKTVCAEPGRDCQRQRDQPRGPPFQHEHCIIPLGRITTQKGVISIPLWHVGRATSELDLARAGYVAPCLSFFNQGNHSQQGGRE